MDNRLENIREHTLSLVDRKVLSLSGVKDVDSFNEEAIAFYEAVGFQTYRRYMELKD